MTIDKAAVIAALRDTLREELNGMAAMTAATRDEATGGGGESKQENKYDTRALEASYLAAGQGERLDALKRQVSWFADARRSQPCARIEEGALFLVEDEDGTERWMYMAPAGGARVVVDGVAVSVISAKSPLGRALMGLGEDDGVDVQTPKGIVEKAVLTVL